MESVWSDKASCNGFRKLDKDIKTDVLIIGGGICGVLCAYMLGGAGVDCVLAEAGEIGGGITKNTTAKITSQHGLIYGRLLREFGAERARAYLDANEEALLRYRELCRNIDCDFEEKSAYTYSIDDRKKIEKELTVLNTLGFNAEFADKLNLPFKVSGAVRFRHQAQFNPLKFISAISKELNIYENTMVRELKGTTAIPDSGTVRAEKIIVATHFPFLNKHGSYFIKLYQHRSYVLALKNAADVEGMYVDEEQNGLSFRNYKELLIIGGGDHRTGKKGGGWKELLDFADVYYPLATEHCRFATQDCMSLDGVPYIGRYSASTKGLYVATGFNKWGMTSSMVSATLLTDMVLGNYNRYAELFSPSRSVMRPQIAINAFETIAGLLSPYPKRCPHLHCALKWNPEEHSWDCPCHGSRFTKDGKLIDNPATGDLKK